MIYILDTDTYDHYHRANANVHNRMSAIGFENVVLTVITRMEVLRARFQYLNTADTVSHLRNAQFWLDESERLLSEWDLLAIDDQVCLEFERLKSNRRLRKIGRADLLIACIALANRATLVTRNVRDFAVVPGLKFENWVD